MPSLAFDAPIENVNHEKENEKTKRCEFHTNLYPILKDCPL